MSHPAPNPTPDVATAALPTYQQLHNERHKHLAAGLRAGEGFEQSALCAARFMRAKYGFVPIRDEEGFFICEIGLRRGGRE